MIVTLGIEIEVEVGVTEVLIDGTATVAAVVASARAALAAAVLTVVVIGGTMDLIPVSTMGTRTDTGIPAIGRLVLIDEVLTERTISAGAGEAEVVDAIGAASTLRAAAVLGGGIVGVEIIGVGVEIIGVGIVGVEIVGVGIVASTAGSGVTSFARTAAAAADTLAALLVADAILDAKAISDVASR